MKTRGKEILAFLIALALFHIVAFVIPFSRTKTFWVGYAFGLISIVLLFAAWCKASSRKDAKSRFLGWPLLYVAAVYMIAQLAASLAFMAFSASPLWLAVLVSAVFLCAALLGLIGTSGATSAVRQIDDAVQEKVCYIKNLQMNIDLIKADCSDAVTRKALDKLSDAIRYSDPMSHASLAEIERQLQGECGLLAELVASNQSQPAQEKVKYILALLTKRNQQCLLLK